MKCTHWVRWKLVESPLSQCGWWQLSVINSFVHCNYRDPSIVGGACTTLTEGSPCLPPALKQQLTWVSSDMSISNLEGTGESDYTSIINDRKMTSMKDHINVNGTSFYVVVEKYNHDGPIKITFTPWCLLLFGRSSKSRKLADYLLHSACYVWSIIVTICCSRISFSVSDDDLHRHKTCVVWVAVVSRTGMMCERDPDCIQYLRFISWKSRDHR